MELNCTFIKNWMNNWTKELLTNKDYLNELDTPIGDNDHGTNMERGAKAIQEVLKEEIEDHQELIKKIAMSLLTKVGGASGVIYGTAFLEMSKKNNLDDMLEAGIYTLPSATLSVGVVITWAKLCLFLHAQRASHGAPFALEKSSSADQERR